MKIDMKMMGILMCIAAGGGLGWFYDPGAIALGAMWGFGILLVALAKKEV